MNNLEDIKNRLAAATPGPWFREYGDVITQDPDPRDTEEGYEDPRNLRIVRAAPHLNHKDRQGVANADFIAHAPEDIARLVKALEAATAALEKHGNPDATLYDDDFNKGYCAGRKALRTIVEEAITEALDS